MSAVNINRVPKTLEFIFLKNGLVGLIGHQINVFFPISGKEIF
jgi:hypothetical protein